MKLLLPVAVEAEHLRAVEAGEPLPAVVRLLEAAVEHPPVAVEARLPEAETAEGQPPSTEPAAPTEAMMRVLSDRPIKFPPN